jgi:hypothetical protein
VRLKAPGITAELSRQVVDFIQAVRGQELAKLPGVAETLDWAAALGHLQVQRLDTAVINHTLGIILKYQDDVDKLRGRPAEQLLEQIDNQ